MAKLCDPDIDMLVLEGCTSPEPSIRHMIEHYYQQVFCKQESKEIASELIEAHNKICQDSLNGVANGKV